jgi:hypothetical protein
MGFSVGYHHNDKNESTINQNFSNIYFLKVKPTDGLLSFPDSLLDNTGGEFKKTRYCQMKVAMPKGKKLPSSISFYEAINTFLSFLSLFAFIFIGVKFIQLMTSFKKEIVFDQKNINKMSLIGKALIVIYLCEQFNNELTYKINSTLFSFSDYKIVSENKDLVWFLLGTVIMIFAEIISRGKMLKEEHDLTI